MSAATVMTDGTVLLGPRLARLERRLSGLLRRRRGTRGVRVEEVPFTSAVGYRIAAWLHLPPGDGPFPAVVLCPDGQAGAGALARASESILTADEVAAAGVACLRFDPAGRGDSWGEEDHGGPEHQDEVAEAARLLAARVDIDAARIGLVGLGDGSVMAVGAAALAGAPVAWVLDWEGPSDPELHGAGDNPPAADDETFWAPRSPVRHVGALPCGYVRLQSEQDHARPDEVRHALRMGAAAAAGALPWFQINDHPRGLAPHRPRWLLPGWTVANRALLRKIVSLSTAP
jgi:dipeptidyl aminopeptidase/acylaminoacyl peptidase